MEVLRRLPENSIDSVVTDPPYGLSFMGKKWDHDVPSVEIWREVFRVLKPGGHLLSFGGTRTYHRMVLAVEESGFEIRDQLQWIFGSGFPKSHNLPGGIGTALKPANEPIVLARKPLIGTVAKNIEKFRTGGINIDASRIASKPIKTIQGGKKINGGNFNAPEGNGEDRRNEFVNTAGRWPANVLFDEEAALMLDEQSGFLHGAGNKRPMKQTKTKSMFLSDNHSDGTNPNYHADHGGGASRFFYCAKTSKRERNFGLEGMPEKMTGISGGAQSQGIGYDACQGIGLNRVTAKKNHHPTVKPIKLMQYLVRLVTPSNGTVLDPFMGSGSTGIACIKEKFDFIGIEMNEEYLEIANKRIDACSFIEFADDPDEQLEFKEQDT